MIFTGNCSLFNQNHRRRIILVIRFNFNVQSKFQVACIYWNCLLFKILRRRIILVIRYNFNVQSKFQGVYISYLLELLVVQSKSFEDVLYSLFATISMFNKSLQNRFIHDIYCGYSLFTYKASKTYYTYYSLQF